MGNEQKPFKTSNVKSTRPKVEKTECYITGYTAGSMNGGHNKTIHYKNVMAGERIKEYGLGLSIKMLTPKTPSFQNLYMTCRAFWVPNDAVWKDAEKFLAQKGGSSEIKIKEIPNLGGKTFPTLGQNGSPTTRTQYYNTKQFRDTFLSSYLPRVGQFMAGSTIGNLTLPKVSVLPLRGFVKIYNEFLRNKELDESLQEFNDNTVTPTEWNSYLSQNWKNLYYNKMRAKRPQSYFSDYRMDIQGFESDYPGNNPLSNLVDWASWESKINESRMQAENASLNDWDIIAKIRGSQIQTEKRPMLIGQNTIQLNYTAVTQNTYNNNDAIEEKFRTLGEQGAYSYTNVTLPLVAGFEAKMDGYIHIIANVWSDSVFENGFDRLELNVNVLDIYRPDLKDQKEDVLYEIETSTNTNMTSSEIIGYKRKFSEYFKLANTINGDMTNSNWFEFDNSTPITFDQTQVITNKTFQFFEVNRNLEQIETEMGLQQIEKEGHKDYTDLLILKNQAIRNPIKAFEDTETGKQDFMILGQNQIFYVGKAYCLTDLPINSEVKDNFTKFGEH